VGSSAREQLRPAGQGQRDHRALPHAARHLVRIGRKPPLGARDAHALEQFQRAPARLGGGHGFVPAYRFDDLRADRIDRVQRQQRLLEDHRRHFAAEIHELARCVIVSTSRPATRTWPAHARAALGMQAQQGAHGHALARARFADQRDHLAALHVEVHAGHGMHGLAAACEADAELAHAHHGFGRAGGC
jgi:hypothetical protein